MTDEVRPSKTLKTSQDGCVCGPGYVCDFHTPDLGAKYRDFALALIDLTEGDEAALATLLSFPDSA